MAIRPDGGRLNPIRPVRWAPFFVEKTTLNAIGIPLKRERAVFQMRQQDRRDANVIIDDLSFGEAGLWIKNFVEPGNGDSFTVDLDRRFSFGSRQLRARTSGNRRPIRCPWFHLKDVGEPFHQYCTTWELLAGICGEVPNVTVRFQHTGLAYDSPEETVKTVELLSLRCATPLKRGVN